MALELFGVGGYDAASMADIAAAAGVTKPVVYQHFVSKRALFLEVLTDYGQRMVAAIEKATADASRALANRSRRGSRPSSGSSPTILLRFASCSARPAAPIVEFAAEVARVENVVADRIAALTIDALADADRRLVAHGIIGLAEGAVRYWMPARRGYSPNTWAMSTTSPGPVCAAAGEVGAAEERQRRTCDCARPASK